MNDSTHVFLKTDYKDLHIRTDKRCEYNSESYAKLITHFDPNNIIELESILNALKFGLF